MKEDAYTIQNTLVKDHVNNYSYNLTSKIDATQLCNTLNHYHDKLQLYQDIDKKVTVICNTLLQIQKELTIIKDKEVKE